MKNTYLVFHLVGYKKYTQHPVQGQVMEDRIVIRLIDKDPESALKRAKTMATRDNWILAEVIEFNKDQKK